MSYAGVAMEQASKIDELEKRVHELMEANREFALNAAKTSTGWFLQTIRELSQRIAMLQAENAALRHDLEQRTPTPCTCENDADAARGHANYCPQKQS